MDNQTFPSPETEIRFFLVLSLVLSLFVVGSFVWGQRVERGDASMPTRTVYGEFPPVAVEAKGAYVYDVRTGTVLYAKNEDTRYPLASLTKVMSALVASELSPDYGTVTVDREALSADGDSGLRPGEKRSLKDLLDFSLVSSSNDGVRAVALALGSLRSAQPKGQAIVDDFVRTMNAKALELDLKNTYFWNETGLDESEVKGGAYGTAKDMARLLEYILETRPELLEGTREKSLALKSLDDYEHVAENTNSIASRIPGLLASKTGYTDITGGNLVLAFDPELGRPIIVTILGSTAEGRFKDAERLISAVLKYIGANE